MKQRIWIWILPLLLLWSCEFQSYEDYDTIDYDGNFEFTEITPKAEWKNRYDHAAVAFDGKLWVLGGYNPGEVWGDTYYEDVWSSEDGVSWELVTERAPWHGRRGHSVVVFDDGNGEDMYLIGGFEVDEKTGYRQYTNDIWRSNNGENWVQIKERTYPPLDSLYDWFPRSEHAVVVANHGGTDYIYIIAGRTQLEDHSGFYANQYFNDVWRSTDGISWEALDNTDFGVRSDHAVTVDPSTGRIYMQGGRHGLIMEAPEAASNPNPEYNNLWTTDDGVTWNAESWNDTIVSISWFARADHQIVFYEGAVYGFPGQTQSLMHYLFGQPYYYGSWKFDDGLWSVESEGCAIKPRHGYSSLLFDNKIWFLGGVTANKGQNNDVWTAE